MPKHRLSLPMSAWPADIAARFETAFGGASRSQRPRLEQGLGRWLLAAEQEDLPAELITPALIALRSEGLSPALAQSMKQALFAVFGEFLVFVPEAKVPRETERAELARIITRNIDRLPPDWKVRAVPALVLSQDGLSDGSIIEARALSAVKAHLHVTCRFFDFCREQQAPMDLTPRTFAALVDQRQAQFRAQDPKVHYSIHTMVVEATHLLAFGRDLFPERDWRWLVTFIEKMKPRARLHPTRNNQRVVDLAELRIAAQQASEMALKIHRAATGYKARLRAHTLARTSLSILLLVNSPIRARCLAKVDLQVHFDSALTRLDLSASETKDKKRDIRLVPPDLRQALLTYIEIHRPLVAPGAETALFVGCRNKRVAPAYLSQKIGDLTEALFGKRVTAHVMRNIIAGFIVSEAPEEAALNQEMLTHADERTGETYRVTGKQIVASRKLSEAADARAGAVGAKKTGSRRAPTTRREVTRRSPARPGRKVT